MAKKHWKIGPSLAVIGFLGACGSGSKSLDANLDAGPLITTTSDTYNPPKCDIGAEVPACEQN